MASFGGMQLASGCTEGINNLPGSNIVSIPDMLGTHAIAATASLDKRG